MPIDKEKRRSRMQRYRAKHRERILANKRKYERERYRNKREEILTKNRRWFKANWDEIKTKRRMKWATDSEFRTKQKAKMRALDHNHATETLRGFLCQCCNAGIGMFYENVEFLRRAIAYLQRTT